MLAAVCLFQAWLLWNFLTFQLKRRREAQAAAPKKKVNPFDKNKRKTKKDEGKVAIVSSIEWMTNFHRFAVVDL